MKLTILDDCFPLSTSGFRLTEYTALMRMFPGTTVVSSLAALDWLGYADQKEAVKAQFRTGYPDLADQVVYTDGEPFDSPALLEHFAGADLLYTIFINNAIDLQPIAERLGIPFAFTLYPGGGLQIDGEQTLAKLSRVLPSPMFAGLIATQPVTVDMLRRRFPFLWDHDRVTYVFGGVNQDVPARPPAHTGAPGTDIAFIANKYEPRGRDKGFDLFRTLVRRLPADQPPPAGPVRFHAVGPWTEADFGRVADRVTLHGRVPNPELPAFLDTMDIAVFPTRAGRLGRGSFDGFPVGGAIEAAKSGVAVVTTNPLHQETPLVDAFVEIRPTARSLLRAVRSLLADPVELQRLRVRGQEEFGRVYSFEYQMGARQEFLNTTLERWRG